VPRIRQRSVIIASASHNGRSCLKDKSRVPTGGCRLKPDAGCKLLGWNGSAPPGSHFRQWFPGDARPLTPPRWALLSRYLEENVLGERS